MNYGVHNVIKNGNYFIAPDHNYNPTNSYECNDLSDCSVRFQEHFDYIAGMGFNAIRAVGFAPKYVSGIGFEVVFKKHDSIHHQNNSVSLPLNPSNPSDLGMSIVLSHYNKILELAHAASLKVIFLIKGEGEKYIDATEINYWNIYYATLASHLKNSSHRDALLAYDIFNEPAYFLNPAKTKQQACEIVSTWYDILKIQDPQCLVTIGNCGTDDIWSFDPSILKVDFNSLHYYPHYNMRPYEDRTLLPVQEKIRIRTASDLYWFNQASIVPWIIGETGFSANGIQYGIADGLDGTLGDMGNFVTYSLNSVCNCGGSGYSWWQYKDVYWEGLGSPSFRENYFGLLARGSTYTEKQPAVNNFRNYTPGITAPCPVDYSPTFDENKIYYNKFEHKAPSHLKVERYVKDLDGNPIKDAVVRVSTFMGKDTIKTIENGIQKVIIEERYDVYCTHTDINGKFIAIPCTTQYNFIGTPQNITPYISHINVSAAGAEVYESSGWLSPGYYGNVPNPISLNKIKDDVTVSGETVSSGQYKDYKGRKSLTVSNTTIQSGGNATFTSQNTILLLPGFTIEAGAEVSIYIAPPDCNELSSFQMQQKSILHSPENDTTKTIYNKKHKNIDTSFKENNPENSISIFPNPTNNTVTIQSNSNEENVFLVNIKLYDIFGRNIISREINGQSYTIDVSVYAKGVYFIVVSSSTTSYRKKIVIQ